MAWADVVFVMICVPHAIFNHFISHWTLSLFLCKMSGFVENLSANATVLNLMLISIERYFVIAHPLSSKTLCSSRKARIALACTWVAAFLLACPEFVVMDTETNKYYNNTTSVVVVMCADVGVGSQDRLAYSFWKLSSLFVIPTCILLFCYIRVICILWLSTRQLQTMTSHSRFGTTRIEYNHQVTLRNGSPQSRLRSSPSLRAGEEALTARRQIVINMLPYIQSCINPIIYVLMSKNIRNSIGQLAASLCACKQCSRDPWADSPSHELMQTNHSQVGAGQSYDTYRSFAGLKSTSHV
ncbi:allatostatin-A receptor-like [Physella acuta]|uniref:allatostatin-A receptor-like n=1 Tax=Physella acuta TaxID=109671 RepID=UPI0027DBD8C9|nr:allatostatin-A receptor-like [Physella acuta]